jgi:signal transduction histidine kinase
VPRPLMRSLPFHPTATQPAGIDLLALHELSRAILETANQGDPLAQFVAVVTRCIAEHGRCVAAELWLWTGDGEACWRASRAPDGSPVVANLASADPMAQAADPLVLQKRRLLSGVEKTCWRAAIPNAAPSGLGGSPVVAWLPFHIEGSSRGLVELAWERDGPSGDEALAAFGHLAAILGIAFATHRAQASLRQGVKHLTCLHGIARAVGKVKSDLPAILQEVAALLPPAWQHPEVARSRILLDDRTYTKGEIDPAMAVQSADIVIRGRLRGRVEVAYAEPRSHAAVGPFLREEQVLVSTVAQEVAELVERRMGREERIHLQDQLRQADRLATLGQLAAGVAHEINEPLASILGFTQLCRKHPGLPAQARTDLDKIVTVTLHVREVIRRLMLFARGRPRVRARVDLNRTVGEGLDFLESRARMAGIAMDRRLAPDLPVVFGDSSQLLQVLVNLVINAIQAMPRGGRLTVETTAVPDGVLLSVEDEGVGIPPDVLEHIFERFFTTKAVGEGTGLGLPVVHEIVNAHEGSVHVISEPGKGSRFEIRLPLADPEAEGGALP